MLDVDDRDRLEMMAAGDRKWDLSPNDRAAIRAALDAATPSDPTPEEIREGALLDPAFDFLRAEKTRLTAVNAKHKRGFRIGDRSHHDTLLHCIEELTEVGMAKTDAERTQEMGDFLGLLFCYADKVGIDMDAAARSAMVKLKLDFPDAYLNEDEA